MRSRLIQEAGLALVLVITVGGCASDGTMESSGGGTPSKASGGTAVVQNDSLQACLARISSSASAGTRQVAEESCKRDETVRAGIVGTASAKSQDRAASGTHGDTLEACMARVPKDATAGQRALAEASCRRDQENRR